MSSLLRCSNYIPENILSDIVFLQDNVDEINKLMSVSMYSEEWADKRRALNKKIKEFNIKQLERCLFGFVFKNTSDLLPWYMSNNTYIQASQKVSKGMECNVFITYRERILGFNDLFKSQEIFVKQYKNFYGCIALLSYCVFENTSVEVDGKFVYGFKGPGGKNPYKSMVSSLFIDNDIHSNDVNSIGKIKKYLTQVFISVCGNDIAPITGKMVRSYIWGVSAKISIDKLIDRLVFAYINEKKKCIWNEYEIEVSNGISRHVAWCTYRLANKRCSLLDQPCHASVECAFYRESKLKRNSGV